MAYPKEYRIVLSLLQSSKGKKLLRKQKKIAVPEKPTPLPKKAIANKNRRKAENYNLGSAIQKASILTTTTRRRQTRRRTQQS